MKRIKEYINKHPKLKRIAKLLGVIAIILSFLFNALIIGSLIINANKPNDSKVLAYGDYQPKYANRFDYNDTEYLTLSLGDFGNGYYIHGMVKTICEYANRTSSFENGLQDLSDNANGPVYLYYSNIHNLTLKVMSVNTRYITDMYFKITDSDLGNTKLLETYLSLDSNSGGYLRIWSYFNPLSFDNNTSFDNAGSILTTYEPYTYCNVSYTPLTSDPVTKSYISCSWTYTSVGSSVQPSPVFDILNSYDYYIDAMEDTAYTNGYNQGYSNGEIAGKAEGIEEGYASGYDAGLHENDAYGLGYTDGYNTGETAGYNQGYSEGSTGMSSNPFKLIANAFDAVASILNIQVLPNLTLGVIIFTPIIVIIILVVVKFIRG